MIRQILEDYQFRNDIMGRFLTNALHANQRSLALFRTNEDTSKVFWDELKRYAPDGSIFGAGIGNIIAFVKAFPDGSFPHYLICVDNDPYAALFGKMIIQGIADYETYEEFEEQMKKTDVVSDLEKRVLNTASQENRKEFEGIKFGTKSSYGISVVNLISFEFNNFNSSQPWFTKSLLDIIKERYSQFHQAAKEGTWCMIYGDIFDPELHSKVKALPKWQNHRNIIYPSNVADHIQRMLTLINKEPDRVRPGLKKLIEKCYESAEGIIAEIYGILEQDSDPNRINELPQVSIVDHINRLYGSLNSLNEGCSNLFIHTTKMLGYSLKFAVGIAPVYAAKQIFAFPV